jgi:DNA-binding GntR family transcriptional regulator
VIKSHLYSQIKEDLKLQILKGAYKEGDLLPSENDLCDLYTITRSTARQALNGLVNEGYIKRRHGKGSIVTNKRRSLGLFTVKGFTREVSDSNEKTKSVILEKPKLGKWTDDFFYPISALEKAAGCISFRRIRFVNDYPVMLEHTCVPNLNLPKFCNNSFVNDSLFDTLSYHYHVEMLSVEQEMRAVLCDAVASKYLKIKKGAPLLQVYLKYLTGRSNLFIYSSILCNTEKFSIGNLL